nr:hypothetical protein [Bacteroidota bacterium]
MNPKVHTLLVLILMLFIITCERERTNPWDDKANIDPSTWAPQNLQIETVSPLERKLTWTYNGDDRIEGFKLDCKRGDDPWQVDYKTCPKETRSWNDAGIVPDPLLNYSYRLYAFAGSHCSTEQTATSSAAIEAPSDLKSEKLSDKSYKITWTDNSTGEQGFKIDRKIDEGNWILAYGTVAANQTNFIDTNVFRAINVEYRVYAFYEGFESSKAMANVNVELTAPTELQISNNSVTSLTITWKGNSTGEDGFNIEKKYEGGTWELLAATTVPHYEDIDVQLNTQLYYRVCAFIGNYSSFWTENNFYATVPPPTDLVTIINSMTSITITWAYELTGQEGFKVDRKV